MAGWFLLIVTNEPGTARRALAKNDAVQISTAIISYEIEYGRMPPPVGKADVEIEVSGQLLDCLRGKRPIYNEKGIVFLDARDLDDANYRKLGGVRDGRFVDPWGGVYKVAIDGDYDFELERAGTDPGPKAVKLRKKVAVWNDVTSVPGNLPSVETLKRRAVASWE